MTDAATARRLVVFCGPTITAQEVRDRLTPSLDSLPHPVDVIALAPVEQGGVIRAVRRHGPHTIAIIDGVFERVPSVWHKEILWALDQGIHVFGASSMGALRAAELHRFGMVGIGWIFEQYRDGLIVDDDEVAVAHATIDDDFRALSTAMVDLRYLIDGLRADGTISAADAEVLLGQAKALPYPQRALPTVLRAATGSVAVPQIEAVRAAGAARGRKHADALVLLDALAVHLREPAGFAPEFFVEPTVFLQAAIHEVDLDELAATSTASPNPSASVDRPTDRSFDVALTGADAAVVRRQALLRILAGEVARLRGVRLDDADVAATLHNLRVRHELLDDDELSTWLEAHGLTFDELVRSLAEVALVDRVEHLHRFEVDASVPRLARLTAARKSRL